MVFEARSFGDGWFHRDWQADDGLPGNNVTGVAQTQNGYLWIATQTGLARFDGLRFENLKIPVGRASPIIRAMLLDDGGQLWLAEEGGDVARILGKQPSLFTSANGLSRSQPLELVQDADGAVWISNADGTVHCIQGGRVTRFGEADGLPAAGACSLSRDANKKIWFAKAGQVGVFRDGKFVTLLTLPERSIQLQAQRGDVWICADNRLMKFSPTGPPVDVGVIPSDTTPVRPMALFGDSTGAVWIGTSAGGLFRCEGTNIDPVVTSHQRIRAITEDCEGNIWVGTDGGGLNRLRRQVVEIQDKDTGLPFDTVRSACEDATGRVWVISQNGDVLNRSNGAWNSISSSPVWTGKEATCMTCDRQGIVWIGTFSHGLFRWQDGKFTVLRRADGLAQSRIHSLLADSRGDLWIAFSSGDVLQCLHDGRFKNFDLPTHSLAIRAFTEDASGKIWMANLDKRLLCVDGDKVVDETVKTSEPHDPIHCITATPDGSLWIGYATGLGRLKDGEFVKIGRNEGLRDDSICSLMPDGRGSMWFGSDHGIFRASLRDLLAVSPGSGTQVNCVGYGRDDGLPSLQAYYGHAPGVCRTRDGRVLIPTHSGLVIVHPDLICTNTVPPPVVIERVKLDNDVIDSGDDAKNFQIPPNYRKLEFAFAAPSFINTENVSIRYMLEGWDENWVDAGKDRSVSYSRLAAGKYLFHVMAANSDGMWNKTGAAFSFEVMPFFWQTWWFLSAAVVGLGGIVFAVVRFVVVRRLREKVRWLEKESVVHKERARIAQDIHDDLGARLTQISLITELAQQALTQPDKTAGHVSQIASLSRQGIKSLDEIVWAVNPRSDTLADLVDYAGQYAVDFLQMAGIRCRVDFPATLPERELSGEVRHGLFLAVKESLNNVVKHAQATEVFLRVKVTESRLQLEITDDGLGFAALPHNALADGLRNMQQRLAEIGGVCSIASEPGAGTTIRFEVPSKAGQPGEK